MFIQIEVLDEGQYIINTNQILYLNPKNNILVLTGSTIVELSNKEFNRIKDIVIKM